MNSALIAKLRDARGLDERSVQRKPVPTFWQVAQSGVLRADSLSQNASDLKTETIAISRGPSEILHDGNLIVHLVVPRRPYIYVRIPR